MELAEATRKKIKKLMKANNMSSYQLSKLAGISLPTLQDFMHGDTKNLRTDTILHICEAFNLTLSEFYSDHLFDNVMAE